MKPIYLRAHERRFTLWKWVLFGSLFLVALNYVSSQAGGVEIMQLGIILGYLITLRMVGMRKLTWGLKLLSGVGLCLLISSIASVGLWGICVAQPSLELCAQNNLRAYTLANFMFPLIVVFVWVTCEIFGSFGKTINYVVRYWKR